MKLFAAPTWFSRSVDEKRDLLGPDMRLAFQNTPREARPAVRSRERHTRSGSTLLSVGIVSAGCLGLATSARADEGPSYEDDSRGIFLPFLDAPRPGDAILKSPRLGLSFGGVVHPVLADTGSAGIMVSSSRTPDNETLPSEPGRLEPRPTDLQRGLG